MTTTSTGPKAGVTEFRPIRAGGGFPRNGYLVEAIPGKTTLALRFLRDGVERGERVLYLTLSETKSS